MSLTTANDDIRKRIRRLDRNAGELQAMPAVVTKAIRCIDDPSTSVTQLAAILSTDQTIAGRLIGLANSALYSGTRRFVTVREAIIRLGFRTVRDLLFAAVVSGLAKAPSKLYGLGAERLWQHSLATAIASRVISQDLGSEDPERGYVAGLLHDVGRVILDRALSQSEIADIRITAARNRISYQAAEAEVLGLTHADVGAHRLTQWGIDPDLVESVARHHSPQAGTLSSLVHVADVLAIKVLNMSAGDPGWDYEINQGILEGFGPSLASTVGNSARLEEIVQKIRADLSEATGSP